MTKTRTPKATVQNMTNTAFVARQAAKYLAAYTAQDGTSHTVGCGMARTFGHLPADAFDGIPAGTCWVEVGRIAAERVLAAAPGVAA